MIRGGAGLAAGVGVDLGIQDQHLDVHAAGQQTAERLEADVVHGAVTAHDPELLVLPALLVPTHANAHGKGRAVLEERVAPGHDVGVVGIGAAVDGVAAGAGGDADVVGAVDIAQGREPHANHRGLATAGARAGAAHVEHALLGQHHVDRHALVDELGRGRRQAAEEVDALLVGRNRRVFLLDHGQGVVAQIGTGLDTLGAALALGRVDEDAELARRLLLPFGHGVELVGLGKLVGHEGALGVVFDLAQGAVKLFEIDDLAQDRRVRDTG